MKDVDGCFQCEPGQHASEKLQNNNTFFPSWFGVDLSTVLGFTKLLYKYLLHFLTQHLETFVAASMLMNSDLSESLATKVAADHSAKSSNNHRTALGQKSWFNEMFCTKRMTLKPMAKGTCKSPVHGRRVLFQRGCSPSTRRITAYGAALRQVRGHMVLPEMKHQVWQINGQKPSRLR